MIAYVKGIIEELGEDYAIVETAGIGYYISMPIIEISKLRNQNQMVKIYTYHYVREDQVGLFGFVDKEALNIFKMLLNVSGVGPKAALAILSALPPDTIVLSIITNDEKTLCKAQGVGKKLAQRLILELKDKFKNYDVSNSAAEIFIEETIDEASEALGALLALGYTRAEATNVLNKIDKRNKIEDIIKEALKQLMKR